MKDASCRKSLKTSSSLHEGNQIVIPSLPSDILIEILAKLPRSCYLSLKLVSSSWKAAILSPELYKVRKELGNIGKGLYIITRNKDDNLTVYALDPQSKQWHRVSQMPCLIGEEEPRVVSAEKEEGDGFHGYGVGAVNGCIYVLGGFYNGNAVEDVWRFDPILNSWSKVRPMSVCRAYCYTSVLDGKLYVVGGLSKSRGKLVALHSGEVFDPSTGLWAPIPSMRFWKVRRSLPQKVVDSDVWFFQATGLSAYNGKLYAPQSYVCGGRKLSNPEKHSCYGVGLDRLTGFGGDVYDPDTNSWVEMSRGMGQFLMIERARSSVVLNGKLYEICCWGEIDCGLIKIYDNEADKWKRVLGNLDVKNSANSISRCLLSDFLGKLHVVTKDENDNIIVVQAEKKVTDTTPHKPDTVSEYMYIWKVIASKAVGSEELVSCHVLDF